MLMKSERKSNKRNKEQTPIIDGDTRPDQGIDQQSLPKKGKSDHKNEDQVTSNRQADKNTMDDFRDAK
jgi:hypothetical protein